MRSDTSSSDNHSSSPALPSSSAHPTPLGAGSSQLPPAGSASFASSFSFPSVPSSRGLSPALIASGALQQHHQAAAGAVMSLPLHLLRLQQQSALAKQQVLTASAASATGGTGRQSAAGTSGAICALLQHASRLPQQQTSLAALQQRQAHQTPPGGGCGAAPEKVHWVQCDRCDKWRVAPFEINATTWVCAQNTWDPRFASCSAPEETNVEVEGSADDGRSALHDATRPEAASSQPAQPGPRAGLAANPQLTQQRLQKQNAAVAPLLPAGGQTPGGGKVKGGAGGGPTVAASKSCAARGKKKAKASAAPAVSTPGAKTGAVSPRGAASATKKGRGGNARKGVPLPGEAGRLKAEGLSAQTSPAGGGVVDISTAASALMAAGLPFSALQHAQSQHFLQHPLLSSGAHQGTGASAGGPVAPALRPGETRAGAAGFTPLQQQLLQHQQLHSQRLLQQIHSYAQVSAPTLPLALGAQASGGTQLVLEHWVQCDACNKWRRAPTEIKSDKWFCSMNTWAPQFASCDAPEEPDPEAADVADAPQMTAQSKPGASNAGLPTGKDEDESGRGAGRGAQKRQRSASVPGAGGSGGAGAAAGKSAAAKPGGKGKAKAKTEKGDGTALAHSAPSLDADQADTRENKEETAAVDASLFEGSKARLPISSLPHGTTLALSSRASVLAGQRFPACAPFGVNPIQNTARPPAVASSALPSVPSLSSLPPAPVPGSGRSATAGGFAGRTQDGKPLKWQRCTSCSKWRRVPEEAVFKNDRFCCYMNVWSAVQATCTAPQEPWQAPAELPVRAGAAAASHGPGDLARDQGEGVTKGLKEGLPEAIAALTSRAVAGETNCHVEAERTGAQSRTSSSLQKTSEQNAAGEPAAAASGAGTDPALGSFSFPASQLNSQQRLQLLLQLQTAGASLGALSDLAADPVASLLSTDGASVADAPGESSEQAKPGACEGAGDSQKEDKKEDEADKNEEEGDEDEQNEAESDSSDEEGDDGSSQGGSGAAGGKGSSSGAHPSGGEPAEKRGGGDDRKGGSAKAEGEEHDEEQGLKRTEEGDPEEEKGNARERTTRMQGLRSGSKENAASPTFPRSPPTEDHVQPLPFSPLTAIASPLSPPLRSSPSSLAASCMFSSLGSSTTSLQLPCGPPSLCLSLSLPPEEGACERRDAGSPVASFEDASGPSTPSTEASAASSPRGFPFDWSRWKVDFSSADATPLSQSKDAEGAWCAFEEEGKEPDREDQGTEARGKASLQSRMLFASWFPVSSPLSSSRLSPSPHSPSLSPAMSLFLSSPLSSRSLSVRSSLSSPRFPLVSVSSRLPPAAALLSHPEEGNVERRHADCFFPA
ncbi:putative CW-type zinc finger domain-containing protein [Neospora caninum Liverpool]|uniref:CW-type zinc finger domain-containing protein,putative n=1 Tax=Neospora caninum (strain Liverpool) TaxID=572307 RepID=F0VI87_NEOCL|nr:putative CW-type zinc finger domain-containing protein [Neospora caninum Liverpool]CBZ53448.1 putative CW-type zinc finger domain-containing protein [Neospora caninum Liverpool]CEL67435.1 TPA: CW-type zinc finger domain-containing protein,putative [Neospora caninum Liverpool]|eukprot:XP_003883480.1 putative CW-type zinc finger domain-containing protein [Neospora caninum Liverpool]